LVLTPTRTRQKCHARNDDDTLLPFSLPILPEEGHRRFDAPDQFRRGVLLLAGADKRLGLIDILAGSSRPSRSRSDQHTMATFCVPRLRHRCGYRMPTIG